MRTITLAVGIVSVGVLGALPFRQLPNSGNADQLTPMATGPLDRQSDVRAIGGVVQWPDRGGFDASLSWQPQPMTLDAAPSFDLPAMPESFPDSGIDVPIPPPVRDRFAATYEVRRQALATADTAVTLPMTAPEPSAFSIQPQDRFVYAPLPSLDDAPAVSPFGTGRSSTAAQRASVVREEPQPVAPRQYIQEPR